MSKVKIRCANCGKWFQSANAKDTICYDCIQKAKKERQATKAAPSTQTKPSFYKPTVAPQKPKQEKSGTNQWLDTVRDVKVGQSEQTTRPKPMPAPPRETQSSSNSDVGPHSAHETYRSNPGTTNGTTAPGLSRDREGRAGKESSYRGPGNHRENDYHTHPYRVGGGNGLSSGPRPRQPMNNRGPRLNNDFRPEKDNRGSGRDGKPRVKTPKLPPPQKPKREKIPPPQPFVPTPEQITQVQTRYIELAQPEFDGIRTQIAQELGIPKKAVKQIIKDLRESQHIPSWWDNENYKGSDEELEKIRELYEPVLPLPDIGIHKKIAEQLSLKPATVYQAIKTIRAQMNLPRYNDPNLHGSESQPGPSQQLAESLPGTIIEGAERQTSHEGTEETNTAQGQAAMSITPVAVDNFSTTNTAIVESASHIPEAPTTNSEQLEMKQGASTEA